MKVSSPSVIGMAGGGQFRHRRGTTQSVVPKREKKEGERVEWRGWEERGREGRGERGRGEERQKGATGLTMTSYFCLVSILTTPSLCGPKLNIFHFILKCALEHTHTHIARSREGLGGGGGTCLTHIPRLEIPVPVLILPGP